MYEGAHKLLAIRAKLSEEDGAQYGAQSALGPVDDAFDALVRTERFFFNAAEEVEHRVPLQIWLKRYLKR